MTDKLMVLLDLPEKSAIELVDALNKPGLDVTIEQIGEVVITVKKRGFR